MNHKRALLFVLCLLLLTAAIVYAQDPPPTATPGIDAGKMVKGLFEGFFLALQLIIAVIWSMIKAVIDIIAQLFNG